jgi:ketosteroid isomerase-like protein
VDVDDPELAVLRVASRSLSDHFGALRAGDLSVVSAYWHPDLVIEHVDGWPVPGTYTGYDGFRQWFGETFGGDYAGYQTRGYEVERIGDELFVLVDTAWTGRDGDELVVPKFAVLFGFRERRICRMRVYLSADAAVAAAAQA